MIFVDSNIPMYLIGSEHPLRERAKILTEQFISLKRKLVSSAEVLQEICHRYVAIRKQEFIQPAFETLLGLTDDVFPITKEDVEQSKSLLLAYKDLSARDALHIAVMKNLGIKEIFSFDKDFDRFVWLKRFS
jgi:uncharacterized protein